MSRGRKDAERLSADVVELARQYGRYGYRKVAALLRQAGWSVSDGRANQQCSLLIVVPVLTVPAPMMIIMMMPIIRVV